MSYYTSETIQEMLNRVRQQKGAPDPTKARHWSEFQPKGLSYQKPDTTEDMYQQLQDSVTERDQQASAISSVMAQNQYNFNQLKKQRKQHNVAQQNFTEPQAPNQQPNQPGGTIPGGGTANPVDWGKDRIPEVSDIKNLNANGPMRTMNFHGRSYTVNAQVAPIFQSFLRDLWRMGYKPASIGGYSDRNIAGTDTRSLHSYGLAIDIDPSKNPIFYNGVGGVYALPKNVGALAAKYGLSWGGNWENTKDYMHFSVAYGGTE